eukprot:5083655-Alexandrium_andersonii.AAC.1
MPLCPRWRPNRRPRGRAKTPGSRGRPEPVAESDEGAERSERRRGSPDAGTTGLPEQRARHGGRGASNSSGERHSALTAAASMPSPRGARRAAPRPPSPPWVPTLRPPTMRLASARRPGLSPASGRGGRLDAAPATARTDRASERAGLSGAIAGPLVTLPATAPLPTS